MGTGMMRPCQNCTRRGFELLVARSTYRFAEADYNSKPNISLQFGSSGERIAW
jgi:hypothetical protein